MVTVTENGGFAYPPRSLAPPHLHDLPSRRRIPHPPRLDPLRINPPSPRAPPRRPSTADNPRLLPSYDYCPPSPRPRSPRSPRSPRHFASPALDDPFAYSMPPHHDVGNEPAMRMPTYRSPLPLMQPHERLPKYPRRDDSSLLERPPGKVTPSQPRLRTSMSSSKLRGRRSKPRQSQERYHANHQLSPRLAASNHAGSPEYASNSNSNLRSSVNSAMTSQSSFEQASGTERSSVLTKSSSITDLSPDTPEGPDDDKDGGMSVEDAISMYLDGFSDVTEEPASPDLYDENKFRPLSPRPPTEFTLDTDGHTSGEDSPELPPEKHLPPVPPLPDLPSNSPDLNPIDQNMRDEQFLDETAEQKELPSVPPKDTNSTNPSPDLNPIDQNVQDEQFLSETAETNPTGQNTQSELFLDGMAKEKEQPPITPPKDSNPPHPSPNLNPIDQNMQDEQFLDETAEQKELPSAPPKDMSPPSPAPKETQEEETVVLPGMVPPPLALGIDTRDRYGFRKTSHHVTAGQYEAWNAPYSEFLANRRVKWAELLREHGLSPNDPTVFPPRSSKMKRFVRKGIPAEYRGAAWFYYAGGVEYLTRNPGRYDELVQQAMESPVNDDKEHIERDLHRTFPDNIHFKPEGADQSADNSSGSSIKVETEMIQSLRRVLYAYALHNPQVGYTQSLNFITGMLLLFLPEEKAFWMLHIITSIYLPGTHEISLEGANIDLWILMVLLKESAPHIYNKISGSPHTTKARTPPLSVSDRLPDITLGLTNWLMSVFIGTLPLETTLRVWDVFFYEGSKTFFRVSLAIFKACEKEILAVSDPMEVFQVVQTIPKRLLDANSLLDDCFVRRHRFGQGRIDELRDSRRAAVRQEKIRRSQAWSKGHLQAATDEWRTNRTGVERRVVDSWRHMRQHAFR